MKAIRIHSFGGPEVMRLVETERPVPAENEILVKVFASGINPADHAVRIGSNELLRSFITLPLTLGWDAAGVVEAIGNNVTGFKKGDEVYGIPNFPGNGSYAEYVAAKAGQFALKPKTLSFVQAAAVPLAADTAWSGLFHFGNLQQGQRTLIHGAAGGVGSFAVQFAKAKGAYVIATASANNLDYLKELGSDEAIDYKNQQFEALLDNIDVVFDSSPVRDNDTRLKLVQVLKNGGVLVGSQLDTPFSDEVKQALEKKNAKGELVQIHDYDSLAEIAALIDEGKVKVTVSKVYSMEDVAEAHKESEAGHVRGKLVLEIAKEK